MAEIIENRWLRRVIWVARGFQKFLLRMITNEPYISGDNFAKICDLQITHSKLSNKNIKVKVFASNSIFIEGHLLNEFVNLFGKYLAGKTIVSGNSDANFSSEPHFPTEIRALYCQNLSTNTDSRFKTIPIGIENIKHARSGFKRLHKPIKKFEIISKVLLPPMSPTNQVRKDILELAKNNKEIFDIETEFRSKHEYFHLVRKYRFIFVCEGNGYDTHRLWEVLYQNSYPVILETSWANSLKWLNLPILFVPNLSVIDQELLSKHDEKFSQKKPIDYPQLWMPFWQELIKSKTKSGN